MHLWVGFWLAIISIIAAGLEVSVLARSITRFTQEVFAALICLIMCYETIYELYLVKRPHYICVISLTICDVL